MSPAGRRVAALVPLKGLEDSKSRLTEVMDGGGRAALALLMAEHVLRTLGRCPHIHEVHLVGGDGPCRRLAERSGASWRPDEAQGLNQAVRSGVLDLFQGGAAAVLALPADLPWLDAGDLEALIEASDGLSRAVLAPADGHGGTNAMLLPEGFPVAPRFGPDSFSAHLRLFQEAGMEAATVLRRGLAFDVDTPMDLARLRVSHPGLDEALASARRRLEFELSLTGGHLP